MITLSLNFDKLVNGTNRTTHEKQIRDVVDTHLGFPGSDKLKMGVTIKENGATSVSFTGPKDAIAEAKRLWRENVTPAAKKVNKAVTRVTTTAKKAVKKAKAKVTAAKSATTKRATKVKAKAKTTKPAAKKRKA
jgi:hypothetical protein